jgi:hypothetical protein
VGTGDSVRNRATIEVDENKRRSRRYAKSAIGRDRPVTPTVLRDGPYAFRFYAADRDEPPHVHVVRDDCAAKIWLGTMAVARNYGFSDTELARIVRLVNDRRHELREAWDDFFGND